MDTSPISDPRLAGFPAVLQELLQAELAAGNSIVEIMSSFPAPPVGACARLAKPVSTRPRASGNGLVFHERGSSLYSGEFTDAKRFHFVLEPPHPPPPEPDMDALRTSRQGGGNPAAGLSGFPIRSGLVERFQAGMEMTYEKWHDGIGYDLEPLQQATPEELAVIEDLLIRHRPRSAHDVEALARIDSARAREALKDALHDEDALVRMAVHRHAAEQIPERERIDSLVAALERSAFFEGLTQALDEVRRFHPPEVVAALWRGLIERDGGTAVHFAAMLWCLYGKSSSSFDVTERPLFLRFNAVDPTARARAVEALRARLGIAGDLGGQAPDHRGGGSSGARRGLRKWISPPSD